MNQIATKLIALVTTCLIAVSALAATPTENCFNYKKAGDYPRAIQSGKEAVRLTPKSGDAFLCLGNAYYQVGDFDLALKNLLQAEQFFTQKSDLSLVYSNLGHVVKLKGDLQQALNYYSRSLGLDRELGDKAGEAVGLSNIAGVFRDRGDLDKALNYYQQSLNINPNEAGKAATYNNIAMAYSDREDYVSAVDNLDKAISLNRRFGNYHAAAQSILNKGSVQTEQRAFDVAETTLNEGLAAIQKVGDKYWESVALEYIAHLAEARGSIDLAKSKYQEALQLAQTAGATSLAESLARKLSLLQKDTTTVSYGVLEIGSKGVKAAVVTSFMDEQGRLRYQTGFKKSINTDVLQGVADTGEFSSEAMDRTAQAASDLMAEIRANSKNIGDNIFVAGSSGLSAAMNRDELGKRVRALTGANPIFINSSQELLFGMIGSIPDNLLHKTALLDIGSGNGRVGYLISAKGERKAGQVVIDLRAGSTSLTELANKSKSPSESYITALNRVVEKEIAPRFASDVKQYPVLSKHHHLMVVGGAAWAMTTLMHPENQGAYTSLSLADFSDYYDRITQNPDALLNQDLSSIADAKTRETATKQIEAVKKTFTLENLQAGARILKLAAETIPLGKADIYFNRDGNWAYGLAASVMMSKRLSKK
ncbi:MAG: tetratricopeptide repeat protein [Sideroxydans sp.]|nr:tetratricopeptide repeat protein [Sideroxydans sp.]